MNLNIYRLEMRRNLRFFIIWALVIAAVLWLGMLFYPAINADGLLTQLDGLFENPMMKGVMGAFGVDPSALGSLMGFFVTYNSMYNILLGCIFSSLLAGNLLAREVADKTAEFLFTRPVSRAVIYHSKAAVLLSYVFLLSLLLWSVSILSMRSVQSGAPRILNLSPLDKQLIMTQVESHPREIYEAFSLDENSFTRLALAYATSTMEEESDQLDEMDFDPQALQKMMNMAREDTEGLFEEVLTNPEEFMSLFHVPEDQKEEFIESVKLEQHEFSQMKEQFFQSPEIFLMFFEQNPVSVLGQFAEEPASMNKAISLLDLPGDFQDRIFSYFSIRKLSVLMVYIFLLILSTGLLSLMISLLLKRGRSVQGLLMGLVFFFFFWDSMTGLAGQLVPAISWLGLISPFHWLDDDLLSTGYGLEFWRVTAFVFLASTAYLGGLKIFQRKDILL